jgi:hypothetical protein
MKMEQTECSEMLAFKLQTPGNNPEESIRQVEAINPNKLKANSASVWSYNTE